MLVAGDVVKVKTWNVTKGGWEWDDVEVINPYYPPAFGPSFVGLMLTGRHKGRQLALQVRHVRGMEGES